MDEQQAQPVIVPQGPGDSGPTESVEHPAKLLRIASMIRELLGEVRQSPLDEAGRARMREIYNRSLSQLKDVLSEDLQQELGVLALPLDRTPSESEIRVSQAQLVGWLEGLFHGIQAAVYTQQLAARAQLEDAHRRGLPSMIPGQPGEPPPGQSSPGQYL